MAFEFSNILASSKSHNDKNMDVTTGSFKSNDGSFNTTSGRNGDKANFKRNNTPPTKRHIADGIKHAVIGLAIIAFLIVMIDLYIYPKENCQLSCSNVSIR